MEKVINLLYDIEEKANRIMDRTNEEKNRLHSELEAKIATFDKELEDDTQKRLDDRITSLESEIEQEKAKMLEDAESYLNELEQKYNDKHDLLVDKIFHKITGV